jgi:hypothetical protein
MRESRYDRSLNRDDARLLRSVVSRFGGNERLHKATLLAQAAARDIVEADVLIAWHDCLLYLIAYPESTALRRAAIAELRRVARLARRIIEEGPARERRRLEGSGLAWATLTFAFGWDIARRLATRFPRHCDIDSFGADGLPLAEALAATLPPLEFALLAGSDDDIALLDEARGTGSRLAWLVAQWARLPCSDAVRALLFDSLKAYLTLRPRATELSRTFVRGLPAPVFYHRDGLVRDFDLQALLDHRLRPARPLSASLRVRVIDSACAMLASLGRETDAIALAYPGGVEWHDVGRGIAVALYATRPDRRDALDSHVGMMLFKNGLPVGYGGGWPFAGTCRIGVNIFEPYRGGESGLLFGQVLRVYRQRFGITRFVVEPSQFGGTNTEGLRSGAFWFYYRLGFRPVDARAAGRACDEHARMKENPGYRTPVAALRRFTDSDVELRIGHDEHLSCEPTYLSAAVTAWIDARFGGDRRAAEVAAVHRIATTLGVADLDTWPDTQRRALTVLAPLLAQVPDLPRWPATDRRRLIAIIRAKGGDEFRFHRLLLRHRLLRRALASLTAQHA